MTDADSLRQIAHSRAPFSVWFGTILLFMLFGAIVLAFIGPSPRRDSYEASRARKRMDNLKTLHEADAKALTGYGWVDKAKGTVHIPIERAMQLTLAELSRKKPAAAYPIATATPAAAAAAPSAAPKSGSSPAATPAAPAGNQPGANSAAQASPAAAAAGKPAASPTGTPNPKAPATPAAGQTPAPTP